MHGSWIMKTLPRSIKYLSTALVLWGVSATPSYAQETAAASDVDIKKEDTLSSADNALGDIVVTAQRREERLQDVPISISALTSETLESSGVTGTEDLMFAVPGLEIARQNGAIAPFIRGIGNRSTSVGEESPVPLYVDGVYISKLAAGLMSFEGIERVEVLKGPQGTLFGRNAAAGVIQIFTRDPGEVTKFDAKFGYGNYDTVEASAYLGGALADGVRANISAYNTYQGDGWGKNLTTGRDVYKGYEHAFRGKIIFDLGPDTELRVAADYSKSQTASAPSYRPLPGRVTTTGNTGNPATRFTPVAFYNGFYNVQLNLDTSVTTRQWGTSAQLKHDFGPVQFVSISSFRDVQSDQIFDSDGTPRSLVENLSDEPSKTFTQEFQLLSNNDSAFKWILGAYYFDDEQKFDPTTLFGTNFPFNLFTVNLFVDSGAKSLAGFGQGTYDFGQGTKLTLGLRYTHDKRTISGFQQLNGVLDPASVYRDSAKFGKLTWRGSLDHRFSESFLAYAAIGRGFKSGVYNAFSYKDPVVRPEVLDSYEVGFKSDLLDRRLRFNGAAFYNDFKDVQVSSTIPGGLRLNNAAAARTYGFELELQARPTKALTISAAMTYLDGEYKSYPGATFFTRTATQTVAQTVGDASGLDTPYT
ncbi:MAG: TonB-dependent receptor, partial [Verrucomicrobiaceae bacterium]